MKKTIILTIILINSFFIYAQNYFNIKIGEKEYYEEARSAIQNNQNEYIINGSKSGGLYIIKLSEFGEILKEKESFVQDTSINAADIIELGNNKYLLLSAFVPFYNEFEDNYLLLTQIDNELNIISEKKIKLPIDTMNLMSILLNMEKANENEIVCYGTCYGQSKNFASFIYKLSLNGDSLLYKTLPEYGINDLIINNSKKIYYFGPQTNDDITVLNYSNFSVDTLFEVYKIFGNAFLHPNANIELLTDTSFVIFGKYIDEIYNNYHALIKVDTNFNIININTEIGDETYNAQAFQSKAMDINFDKEILTASNEYYGRFQITKTDSELNIIWEHLYDIEPTAYWFSAYATNDGGCMILGTDDYLHDISVIKTDVNGNITYIDGKPTNIKPKNFQLYPDPASDFLKIRKAVQVTEAEFILYNSLGQIVLQKTLSESITEISISALSKGVYVYNIFVEGNLDDEGKLVIE